MPSALNERVETPTHRSRRTHQRTGADERKRPIPTAHFMAFFGAAESSMLVDIFFSGLSSNFGFLFKRSR